MYTKEYHIGSNDVDQFLELKLSSFFKMMQDIATEHAEILDIGKGQTIDKGLYWVITRVELDIIRMPRYLETVKLTTYPGDDMRFIFPRYFYLEDQDGNTIMRVSSVWMVLRKENRQPALNPFEGRKFPEEHLPDELALPKKCSGNPSIKIESRKVRYSDIDLNGHLNNTKYIDYIIDIHDSDFYKKNRIKHFLINYEKELLDNDVLDLYSDNNKPEAIKGMINDNDAFMVNITYEDR